MWKYSYLVHFRSFFGQVVNIQTFSRKCHFYFRFKMAAVFKLPLKWPLTVVLAMAPYPIFLSALKTVIMPIFVLLTESEQFEQYSRIGARVFVSYEFEEYTIENIKSACMKHVGIPEDGILCCDVLAGEQGPSCSLWNKFLILKLFTQRRIQDFS